MKNSTIIKKASYSLIVLLFLCSVSFKLNGQINTYLFSQSSETYTPLTSPTVLATATTPSGPGSIDDTIISVLSSAWGFPFQFNYSTVSQIKVSSNGFITFGSVAPSPNGSSTGYTPISAVTAYDGCASAMGRNLNSYGPGGTITPAQYGELSYGITGVTPNRKFVVQYKNFRPSASATTFTQVFNFQIRLCETSSNIEIVYGTVTATSVNTLQVGIRGNNNTIFLNRSVISGTNTWNTSVAGTLNNSTCAYNNTGLVPASGLIFRYGPPPCPAPINLGATNITGTTADLTWSVIGGGGTFNVEYGLSGFTPGTGTIVNNIAGTSLSISGLTGLTNYQFYVTQNCSSSGNGLSVTSGPKSFSSGGPGEDCASATVVSVAANQSGSSTLITSGLSQNGANASCSDGTGNIPNDDRWIKFTAPSNGNKLVILTTAGTVNDWVMELWNGCPGSGGSLVDCADDDTTFMPLITLCQDQYTPGQQFYLRMWTYSSAATGNMNLKIYETTECAIPPANDACSFATRINITPPGSCPASGVTLTTKYATASGDPSACGTASAIHDVWMVFNTGNFGDFNLNLSLGTATSLKAAIFFECNGAEISCYNPAVGSHTITGLNPGADYILRVWSDTTGWGTFNVCLSDECLEPTASISGSTIICAGDSAHISVTLGGGGPWTINYSDGVNSHIAITSNSPYVIDTAPAATTFYSLISVSNPTCFGTVSGNYLVNVVPKPQINNFTPSSGPVGTPLTINGSNFTNVSLVGINNVNGSAFTIINSGQITLNVPAGSTSGLVSVKNLGCTVYSSSVYTVTGGNVTIALKVYIAGFYQSGAMAAVLDPVNKPNVCDSLELQLYGSNSPYPFIISRSAELSTNGDISFSFPSSIAGSSYYLALKHRNTVETWSKNPVLVPSGGVFYDFVH